MIIKIPNYRARSRNKTVSSHWRTYQRERDDIGALILYYARDRRPMSCVRVTINAYFSGKVGIDTSNIDDKLILDGIMHAGILKDDAPAFNPEIIKRSFPNAGVNELHILIEEVGEPCE